MIWQNLTSSFVEQLDRRIPVLLPVAAVEQHGPHLPLATDRLIVEHFCDLLEKEIGDQVLILPTVSVGCSSHHMDFAGTLTVSHNTFIDYVLDILESVAHHGFKNLVILNSHGGNVAAVQLVVERFGNSHRDCRVVTATWWKIASEELLRITETGPGGVGHAGEFETSLIEVAAPQLVDRRSLQPGQNTPTFAWATGDMLRGPNAILYRSMKEMTANGVFGNPVKASKEKGIAIGKVVTPALKAIITDLYHGDSE